MMLLHVVCRVVNIAVVVVVVVVSPDGNKMKLQARLSASCWNQKFLFLYQNILYLCPFIRHYTIIRR